MSYALNMRNHFADNSSQGVLIWVCHLVFIYGNSYFLFKFLLIMYYPHPISIFHWPYLLSVVSFWVLVLFLVRFYKNKLFIFAFLYFFCSIFFLLRFDGKDFNVVADRFMYLPSLGICFFVGYWVDQRIKTRRG